MLLTIPNLISFVRIPLAFLFLEDNAMVRGIALLLAMLSDCIDGFVARYCKTTSRFGTFLDPVSDKFFVLFVLCVFIKEHKLQPLEALTMLCRDFSIIIFGFYLAWKGTLSQYQFRSIWSGKIMTSLQFVVLMALTFNYRLPASFFLSFVIIGATALVELYRERQRLHVE